MYQAAPRLAESEGQGTVPSSWQPGESRPALSLGDEVTCQADSLLLTKPLGWSLACSMRAAWELGFFSSFECLWASQHSASFLFDYAASISQVTSHNKGLYVTPGCDSRRITLARKAQPQCNHEGTCKDGCQMRHIR